MLFADGMWSPGVDDAPPVFRAAPAPSQSERSAVVEAIAADLAQLIPPREPEEVDPDLATLQGLERVSTAPDGYVVQANVTL